MEHSGVDTLVCSLNHSVLRFSYLHNKGITDHATLYGSDEGSA